MTNLRGEDRRKVSARLARGERPSRVREELRQRGIVVSSSTLYILRRRAGVPKREGPSTEQRQALIRAVRQDKSTVRGAAKALNIAPSTARKIINAIGPRTFQQ